jgi:hypothetical protein
MKNNNRNNNQYIRVNNFKNSVTNNNTVNKKFVKNNVNNNNINTFNNNKSFCDKDEDELSQSSGEPDGFDAAKRFLKNRLLIYDDIIITYNRITNDEKLLLNKQKSLIEPFSAIKQNSFVEPLHITKTNPSNTTVANNVTVNDTSNNTEISNNIVNQYDNFAGQQRHNAMKKFMANGNSSTSMYWKEDSIDKTYNNNNRPTNIVNTSKKSLINNNIKNRSTKINNTANKKSFNKTSCDEKSRNKDHQNNNSDSCSINSRVNNNNECDNSVVFSPSGSKKNGFEQQNVEAILNNDDERFENDNTTNNKMNFNNDSENNVLSRSIINADTNGCPNEFGTLSLSKDMVGNNLNERFEKNNTIVNTMNNININH